VYAAVRGSAASSKKQAGCTPEIEGRCVCVEDWRCPRLKCGYDMRHAQTTYMRMPIPDTVIIVEGMAKAPTDALTRVCGMAE